MKQYWQKHGLIYDSRAQIPTVFEKDDKTWRIYFSDRTKDNKSFIRYVDVEPGNPKNIIYERTDSILELGPIGSFDHFGVMPSCIVRDNGTIYLYYIGWAIRKDVPYQNSIGLAISNDQGETFKKVSEGPILSNDTVDPYFCSTPWIVQRSSIEFLFYLSCTGWEKISENEIEAKYLIKSRERHNHHSNQSGNWPKFAEKIIDYTNPTEGGICRPSIIVDNNIWHMWYCYRDLVNYRGKDSYKPGAYKVGYAAPDNGIRNTWVRKDSDCILTTSDSGWDSEMVAYPCVIKHKDKYYMFYNGNGFGASGFGYATIDLL